MALKVETLATYTEQPAVGSLPLLVRNKRIRPLDGNCFVLRDTKHYLQRVHDMVGNLRNSLPAFSVNFGRAL